MIETHYVGLLVSATLIINGVFLVLFPDNKSNAKYLGMALLLFAGFMAGALLEEPVQVGTPANASDIAPFQELRIVKRIDRSLSVVKSVDGKDERIVEGIPEHVLEGDVFIVKRDGTVIVSKRTIPSVTDGVDGQE